MVRRLVVWLGLAGVAALAGCHHPEITAVSLAPHICDDRCTLFRGCHKDQEGIPFYLPKPLLIVAKNFRNIEDSKVGLTDSAPIPNAFDDQGKYADLNARASFNFDGSTPAPADGGGGTEATPKTKTQTVDPSKPAPPAADNVPPASTASKSGAYTYSQNAPNVTPHDLPDDGLAPNVFYTYQIVFVPDLTQKYGLKIKGGVGEIRAAMNLVNGWQFTGLGPYYMKDSSTAQDVMASGIAARLGGQAAQDVLKGVAGLTSGGLKPQSTLPADSPQVQHLAKTIQSIRQDSHPLMSIPNYAEIRVYEARLGLDGMMEWVEITNLSFDRPYVGGAQVEASVSPISPKGATSQQGLDTVPPPNLQNVVPEPQLAPQPGQGAPQGSLPGGGGVDPGVLNRVLSEVLMVPPQGTAAVPVIQSGLPSVPALPGAVVPSAAALPVARPAGTGLLHHDKKRRGTAVTRVLTADTDGGAVGAPATNPNVKPTAGAAPPPVVNRITSAPAPAVAPTLTPPSPAAPAPNLGALGR